MSVPVIALVGRPNVGKSALFNRIIGENSAIVSEEPGTTRDYLSETLEAAGVQLTLVDTAGSFHRLSGSVAPSIRQR